MTFISIRISSLYQSLVYGTRHWYPDQNANTQTRCFLYINVKVLVAVSGICIWNKMSVSRLGDSIQTKVPLQYNIPVRIRVSSNQSNFFFGSNRNKPKLNLFRLFLGLFRETKKHFFFGLFRCFGPALKQPKQTELCQNKPKKSIKKRFLSGGSRHN